MQTPLIALRKSGSPCFYKLKLRRNKWKKKKERKKLEKKRDQTVANSNKEQFQLFTLRHFTDNVLLQLLLHLLNAWFSKAASWQFLRSFPYFKSCLSFLFFFGQDSVLHWSPPPVLKMPLADVSCRLAQLFISAGANPDALNKEGQTPIMVAIMQVCLFNLTHYLRPVSRLPPLLLLIYCRSFRSVHNYGNLLTHLTKDILISVPYMHMSTFS